MERRRDIIPNRKKDPNYMAALADARDLIDRYTRGRSRRYDNEGKVFHNLIALHQALSQEGIEISYNKLSEISRSEKRIYPSVETITLTRISVFIRRETENTAKVADISFKAAKEYIAHRITGGGEIRVDVQLSKAFRKMVELNIVSQEECNAIAESAVQGFLQERIYNSLQDPVKTMANAGLK